jgi:hypothetical protein
MRSSRRAATRAPCASPHPPPLPLRHRPGRLPRAPRAGSPMRHCRLQPPSHHPYPCSSTRATACIVTGTPATQPGTTTSPDAEYHWCRHAKSHGRGHRWALRMGTTGSSLHSGPRRRERVRDCATTAGRCLGTPTGAPHPPHYVLVCGGAGGRGMVVAALASTGTSSTMTTTTSYTVMLSCCSRPCLRWLGRTCRAFSVLLSVSY